MELRCSPYNAMLFFGILGILLICNLRLATAQCSSDFSYQSYPADQGPSSGKIEITSKNPEPGNYTFKVFKIEGTITLVRADDVSSPEKIIIEGLAPGSYLVKMEWDDNCYRTVGGLEGILITRKE